jgi:hypothetical protein
VNVNSIADMRIHAITFATPSYLESARFGAMRALQKGADSIRIFTPLDFETDPNLKELLTYRSIDFGIRGAGYWLWKPTIILSEIQKLAENEYLLYFDSSITLDAKLNLEEFEVGKKAFHVWAYEQHSNNLESWTDGRVLDYLDVSPGSRKSPMVIAGFLLIKKTKKSLQLIEKWLEWSLIDDLLCPDRFEGYSPTHGTIWHRHDQSLLSILVAQNPEDFGLEKIDEFEAVFSRPLFIQHRRLNPKFIFMSFLNYRPRIVARRILNFTPSSFRQWVREVRNKKKISVQEQLAHKNFYGKKWP